MRPRSPTERLEPRLLLATITGRVADDFNVNGFADAGEAGVAGFVVYLDVNANLVRDAGESSSVTDASGAYDLGTGGITGPVQVRLEERANWGFTAPAGGVRTVAVNNPDDTYSGINFLASTRAVFTGRIFHDADADGVMDPGEPPLQGWTVFVDLDHNNVQQSGEPSATSDATGVWSMNLNGTGPDPFHRHYHFVQPRPAGWERTAPPFTDLVTVITHPGRVFVGMDWGSRPVSTVAGRHVFYNNSTFDGRSTDANAADDGAVATDKAALLPGQTSSFENVTSYSRGINGVMVDLAGLPATTQLSAADFDVQVGGDSTWTPAPAPSVDLRRGAGAGGGDRVTLTWPDGLLKNTWLRVTVKANANTALLSPDVFAFGNLAGETGDTPPGRPHVVTVLDFNRTRAAIFSDAPVTSRFDHNRDGRVSALDLAIVRSNLARRLSPAVLPSGAPAALPSADATNLLRDNA